MQTYAIISNPIPSSFYSAGKPMAPRLATSSSTQHLPTQQLPTHHGRLPASASAVSLAFPQSASMHSLAVPASRMQSSGTWTTSSAEMGDVDEIGDRDLFVFEYNRLAKKHGVRLIMVDDFTAEQQGLRSPDKRGWLQRLLRAGSQPRHKRSVSDLAHMLHTRREPPKTVEIQDMVRLSGKSMLYLPQEYTPCSLVLPTCIRATAQHLSQNVTTRGLFRIPGSVRVVTALFDHYCHADASGGDIAGTVRGASLPLHIAHSVHDVASTFKRLLSVLPGGILGSLSLLDALVAIYSQLNGEPEFPRTKQTKVRARLIALAIGTVKSTFRRELICAVFGLLSLIGRAAEVAPREDDEGRPLPTSDLMGYGALGIVFGPLLVGNMLEQYTMKLVTPTSGMLLFPLSPPRGRRDRRKDKAGAGLGGPGGVPAVDKVLVANGIAEMLIANWRDVVRQMRSLGMQYRKDTSSVNLRASLRPSMDQYSLRVPSDAQKAGVNDDLLDEADAATRLGRRRSKPLRNSASQRLLPKMSMATLSPTREESSGEGEADHEAKARDNQEEDDVAHSPAVRTVQQDNAAHSPIVRIVTPHDDAQRVGPQDTTPERQVSPESIPPRVSSRSREDRESSDAPTAGSSSRRGTEASKMSSGRAMNRRPRMHSLRSCQQASSFDGSEDSASRGEGLERRASQMSQALVPLDRNSATFKEGRSQSRQRRDGEKENVNADSSSLETGSSEGRSRAVDAAEARDTHPSSGRLQSVDTADVMEPISPVSPRGHLQPVDTTTARDEKPRASLDQTPDGFYPKSNRRDVNKSVLDCSQFDEPDNLDETAHSTRKLSDNPIPDSTDTRPDRSRSRTATDETQQRWEHHGARQASAPGSNGQVASRGHIRATVQTPSRSSSSEALSKRGSVRAMAAKFKSQEPSGKVRWRAGGDCGCGSGCAGCVCRRPPLWRQSSSEKSPASSVDGQGSRDSSKRPNRRNEAPDDSVRRPAGVDAAAQTDDLPPPPPPLPETAPMMVAGSSSMPALKWTTTGSSPLAERVHSVPSLGTMVPHREQPPVAQHLHRRARPLSAQLNRDEAETPVASFSRASSGTTLLYSQIQRLQRHLGAKTEEASQLRRQLDAQEGAEAGTLSEQLRESMREASMWRERAVSAERRVKVFERFSERLRGIRDAIFRQPDAAQQEDEGEGQGVGEGKSEGVAVYGSRTHEIDGSDDSGRVEDAGVVAARIRKCLHRRRRAAEADGRVGDEGMTGGDGTWSPESDGVCSETELMWEVARELLDMEDEGVL